jgi:hypothetical protein
MKTPSRNISKSLAAQQRSVGDGRAPEMVDVSPQVAAKPSMIVPGDGQVERDWGQGGQTNPRSAANYTGPMARHGGA